MADADRPRAELPPQPSDIVVTVKGIERPWLSRVIGKLLWPWIRRRAQTNTDQERSRIGMIGNDISFDELASERPVVKLFDLIVSEALLRGATAIRLSAAPDGCHVRYQLNGEWREQMRIPTAAARPLFNVVRIRANLDRTSVPRPHAGEMRLLLNGKEYRLTAELRRGDDGTEELLIHCPGPEAP